MPNRLGIAGIEFIEYATSRPQAHDQVLETVAERVRRSALWLHQDVLHKSAPLPAWVHTGG